MYSRMRARVPSARQGGEQYDMGLPFPSSGGNAPPQTRHLAARFRARRGAAAAEAEAEAVLPRARAFLRQGSEQYLTARLGVSNALPHSLQPARCVRATFLSTLAAHRAQ